MHKKCMHTAMVLQYSIICLKTIFCENLVMKYLDAKYLLFMVRACNMHTTICY